MTTSNETHRIQKLLAEAGFGSRREMERWIDDGRVSVNGKRAKLGEKASYHDKICIDNDPIKLKVQTKTRVLLYYKPEGEICTNDDEKNRRTVFSNLPEGRWISVGRLDLNTSGLLLFTNDGELANKLMHPRYQNEREYAVRVLGCANKDTIKRLLNGVQLEDGIGKFTRVKEQRSTRGHNTWYHVTIKEGRKREVRRLWESQDFTVSRLIRIRFDEIHLPQNMSPGQYVELKGEQLQNLLRKHS